MGACAMVRMGGGRGTRGGRGRGFYSGPVSYTSPPPRYIYQTSPTMAAGSATAASPQFYQTTPTAAYFDAASPKRSGEEQMNVPALVEVAHPGTGMTIKTTKNSVQVKQVMVYRIIPYTLAIMLAHCTRKARCTDLTSSILLLKA